MQQCRIIICVLLLIAFASSAQAEWTKRQRDLELTYQILHFVDWRQTRHLSGNPDDYYEVNPIMGRHPSKQTVDAYFAASSLAHVGISAMLPDEIRDYWQMVTIGIKTAVVGWNFSIGIKMEF